MAKPQNRTAQREARTAAKLSKRTFWSRIALATDRIVLAAWPAFATVSFFYAATAFGLWRAIDDVWRLAALAVFALAAAYSLWRLVAGFAWPAWRDGRRRLDRGRDDRPVAAFDERLAIGAEDDGASALWGAHRVGVTKRAEQVRAAAPDLVIGRRRDPLYLRYLATAALAAALIFGPGQPSFSDAVRPMSLVDTPPPPEPSLEVWATPPAYTGAPPLYFADRAARIGERSAPQDTVLSVRLFDVDGTPVFLVEPEGAAVGVVERSPLEGGEAGADGDGADELAEEQADELTEERTEAGGAAVANEASGDLASGDAASSEAAEEEAAVVEAAVEATAPAELRAGDGDGVFLADIRLLSDARISLNLPGQIEPALDLSFTVTPDREPVVLMADPPARSGDGELSFSFRGADDYGVARAWALIELDPEARLDLGDGPYAAEPREPYEFELPTPLARFGDPSDAAELTPTESAALDDEARAAAEEDARLTALYGPPNFAGESFAGHPWVGLPVTMRLYVEDAKGQLDQTEVVRFELPGRLFSEPMAKSLIEQRGSLAWNVELAARAHRILSALTRLPESYFTRSSDYLFTRMAIARLALSLTDDRVVERRDEVMAALYAAAERLEDAGLDSAAERLARAERRLREALENGASDEELAELMRELREAIQAYLQALRELAERNPELAEQMMRELGQNSQALGSDQLQEMLRALEDAARGGRREEAEQMLSMLEQLLDSLRPGGQAQAGQGQQGEGQQGQGEQALEELEEMIQEQQRQAEDSFEAERQRRDQEQFGQGQPDQGQPNQGRPGQSQPGQGQQGQQFGQGQPGQNQPGQGQPGQDQFGQQQQPGQQGRRGGRDAPLEDQPGFGANPDGLANEQGRPLDSETLRQRQEALRQMLEDLESRMDDLLAQGGQGGDLSEEDREFLNESRRRAQDSLEEAEESMRAAEDALERDAPGQATDEQIDAVESLRDAYRSSREAAERADRLARGDQQPNGQPNRADQGPGQEGRDPLGRPRSEDPSRRADTDRRNEAADGTLDDSGLRPGGLRATPREEARRILEDIRRRLSDRERTLEELDYLRRLLERF